MSQFSLVPEMDGGNDISLPCAADLSAAQYHFVYLVSGLVVLATTGVRAIGVLQNKPVGTATKHAAAQVRMFGFTKLLAGTSGYSSGAYLVPNTSSAGDAIASTSDHNLIAAMAIGDASAGDIAAAVLTPGVTLSI